MATGHLILGYMRLITPIPDYIHMAKLYAPTKCRAAVCPRTDCDEYDGWAMCPYHGSRYVRVWQKLHREAA